MKCVFVIMVSPYLVYFASAFYIVSLISVIHDVYLHYTYLKARERTRDCSRSVDDGLLQRHGTIYLPPYMPVGLEVRRQ